MRDPDSAPAPESIRLLEHRFFRESPLLAALADLQGHFLSVGGPWMEVLGWTHAELMARPFLDLVHPEDLDRTVGELEVLGRGEPVAGFVNRYRTRDGRWVWLQWHAHPLEEGTILATAQDVSEGVARDASLERRTRVLEALAEFQQGLLRDPVGHDAVAGLLARLVALTGSEYGCLGRVVRQPDQTLAAEVMGWATQDLATPITGQYLLRDLDTPYGQVLRSGAPVLLPPAPGRRLVSELPLVTQAFLGMPVVVDGAVAGLLLLGNAPDGYADEWLALLVPVQAAIGQMLEIGRSRARELRLEQEVHRWSALFSTVIESAGVSVITTDPAGTIQYMNPVAQRLLGSLDLAISTSLVAFHDPPEIARHAEALKAEGRSEGGTPFDCLVARARSGVDRREWTYVSLSGARQPMMVTMSPRRDRTGALVGWVAVGAEVEERRAIEEGRERVARLEGELAEHRRREAEVAQLAAAMQYAAASRSVREALEVIAAFLPAVCHLPEPRLLIHRTATADGGAERDGETVDSADCWALRTAQAFVSDVGGLRCPHLAEADAPWICAPLTDGTTAVAVLSARLPAEPVPAPADGAPERESVPRLLDKVRQLSNVMANIRLHQTLEHQAMRDPLTGAINRRRFDGELRQALLACQRREEPFALLLLDIDHFKAINDRFGHERGDEVLVGVSRVVRQRLRASDVFARLGGEEFAVLLPRVDAAAAAALAEALRAGIAAAALAGDDVPCTCSIGALHVASAVVPAEDLLRRADRALYAAKAGGRDRVVFGDAQAMPSGSVPVVDAA